MSRQLPLEIRLPREPDLAGFVVGDNGEALAAVQALCGSGGEPYLYLWGEPGSGKTHLLLGACRALEHQGRPVQYLDLGRHQELHPDLLLDLERLELVCLDRVQTIAGLAPWEQALFGLFDRLRAAETRLLVAGDRAAGELPLGLADLHSRLTWGPGFRLRPLDDAGRLELLHRSASARGMRLEHAAARYVLNHCPRDTHSLEALLERLDHLTLAEQRRPTIALIRRALAGDDPP
jgi:DnaA-homolog protein